MESKIKSFNGTGNVKVFIEKVTIHSALKGFEDEKAAQNLASRLEGRAFDAYRRFSVEDKEDVKRIEEELLKEFERGKLNRDLAIQELSNRHRKQDESPQVFAYNIMELVQLAYPDFDDSIRQTIAKDYFVNGLHAKMQIALKSMTKFASASLNELAEETIRLQTAGIESNCSNKVDQCMSMDNDRLVDVITDKVTERIENLLKNPGGQNNAANFVSNRPTRGNRPSNFNRRFQGRKSTPQNNKVLKCRSCQSSEHLFRACPTRFCQACGNRGHDAWDSSCPNFQ